MTIVERERQWFMAKVGMEARETPRALPRRGRKLPVDDAARLAGAHAGSGEDTWFGAAVDIDDLHTLSENRDLLARELSDRIKNIFAVVSGLVSMRARGRQELKGFAGEINDVFHALGRAHDYVRPLEGRKGDSLHELLRDLLAPYRGADGEGLAITGDDAAIGPRAATPLALVFHELATNSAKYGALSAKGGEIAIAISREDEVVMIGWRENDPSCWSARRRAGMPDLSPPSNPSSGGLTSPRCARLNTRSTAPTTSGRQPRQRATSRNARVCSYFARVQVWVWQKTLMQPFTLSTLPAGSSTER